MELKSEQALMASWSGQTQPVLSIICLAYNHAGFIRKTLEGFLEQETDFPFEIIVHDDASSDTTPLIIAEYAARYPTVIKPIYQAQNQYTLGVPFSTRLFAQARGRYIAYCEGDDYWTDSRKLQIQVDFLENNRDYVMTYHDAFMFDSKRILRPIHLTGKYRRDASAKELMQGRPISTLTVCFRNVIHELPPELHGVEVLDICWWSLLGAHGKGKFIEAIRPAAYRVHEGGIFSMRTSQQRIRMSLHAYYSLARYYQRIGNKALYDYFLVQVFSHCLALISPANKLQALFTIGQNIAINLFKRISPATSRS
ncbi:glycosyltransferase involved in cell wall biosynthesis [Pseudomonas duriflava]|uniref:Glycosyltransferase involved in cell wall biosynthesis n=1 Tax=Pseudomonas duriflava TaxID=459528 RepID=A0A562QIN8_9PSED|nr:glycosyltransferase [Pseudomonas duriflava]TWI56601.1 glycosyltransferase involved in cell wall biosynthesis [Pseudomonas duriflava]